MFQKKLLTFLNRRKVILEQARADMKIRYEANEKKPIDIIGDNEDNFNKFLKVVRLCAVDMRMDKRRSY